MSVLGQAPNGFTVMADALSNVTDVWKDVCDFGEAMSTA